MDSNIVEKISHLLNEEKWTRSAISSFSVSNFDELDAVIREIADDETKAEVLKICDEHLAHNKNSIVGLYISGMLILSRNPLDDSSMLQLLSLFTDAAKWNVAETLCARMLKLGENKSALKILAECYEAEGLEDKKIETWERIIRADHEEADIAKALAEKYESDGDIEKAVSYYKKAILRFAHKKLFVSVKDIWTKLLEIDPDDLDFFHYFLKKVSRTIQADKIALLMDDLYQHYKAAKDWDNAISMLKEIITLETRSTDVRKEIIECYTAKYSGLPHFQNAMSDSNLSQSWRPINDAISDFEKHIAFAKGNFVFHNNWGIGRIKEVKDENITIDFIKKQGHMMNIKMAVESLSILPKEHFWVIKCTHKLPVLQKMVMHDVAGTLKTIIKSYDNCADLKIIKKELTPRILGPNEWTSWSQKAKKELMENPEFGNILEKKGFYEVRVKPISMEEKLFNQFKTKDKFFDKYAAFQEYIQEDTDKNEFYNEMLDYFDTTYKNTEKTEEKVCSWLLLSENGSKPAESFAQVFSQIPEVENAFCAIPERHKKLWTDLLAEIRKALPDWPDIYCKLLPCHLGPSIPDALIEAGYTDKVKAVFEMILNNFKSYRKPFVWVCEHEDDYSFIKEIMPGKEKILSEMILLLDQTNREIASTNKKNSQDNIKIGKQIEQYLFKERIESYILGADQKNAKIMLSRLEGVANLDIKIVPELKKKLKEKFPNIVFESEKPVEVVSRGGILVTEAGMDRKRQELKHIVEVEIPKNSKEIGEAIALGDLSENAEYKYGKEKQEMLNIAVGKLSAEIDKAKVFDKSTLNLSKVSFGTKVTLHNLDTDQNVVYTILGPWESDPEKNIISYIAPLGDELLGAEVDDELHFEINDTVYNFKVLSIEASELL